MTNSERGSLDNQKFKIDTTENILDFKSINKKYYWEKVE
jgi:hypothetical protein